MYLSREVKKLRYPWGPIEDLYGGYICNSGLKVSYLNVPYIEAVDMQ